MTAASWLLLAVAAALGIGDWVAVARGDRRLEYIFKPAVMLALIGLALTLHPAVAAQRGWFLAALGLGLLGDVCLVLPVNALLWGLAAFLLGHLAYIGGFIAARGEHATAPLVLVLLSAVFAGLNVVVSRPVLGALSRSRSHLLYPVVAYGAVWAVLLAFALTSPGRLARIGALAFWFSDILVGFDRFVRPARPRIKLLIIVSYHLGQAALVLSLAIRP